MAATGVLSGFRCIVIVGDSIAYGRADASGGWAHRLAEHHIARDEQNNRVFNLSWPGATLHALAQDTVDEALSRRPDAVLLAAGINDLAGVDGAKASPLDVLTLMDLTADAIARRGAGVVVMGPCWFDEKANGSGMGLDVTLSAAGMLRRALSQWAPDNGHGFIDPWPALEGRADLLVDGIHPGPAGHELLWRAVRDVY
ncbi:SGNH/GDSL hydrolase family protein [Propionibacterium australiense]|uniref:SGNH hydrolase-type esterase domain n=1 Tax=Propionibacterium australiense TaxID=119981 RepID=A0A383S820_9ACTN|nr:SGNH/GDSL hydrolase family protein [Propionibacterium australiense]RLP07513.1 SGNH/GDSL hydrolase family protein [Propionibacterium australiense]SYZ34118.1 SGNH hydrolase-type esterase domain [Propionibacterium australiense]VEH88707.1 GDSL-like Lipase/Acylhydrolase [Propionibacterium australiense]